MIIVSPTKRFWICCHLFEVFSAACDLRSRTVVDAVKFNKTVELISVGSNSLACTPSCPLGVGGWGVGPTAPTTPSLGVSPPSG